jgi:thymidylate synthase (FAD)
MIDRIGVRVLDHGYIEIVDTWGSDEGIVEAARMSTGKGFLGWGPKAWKCNGCGAEQPYSQCRFDSSFCRDGCEGVSGFTRVDGDEKLLRFLYEHQHMTPFEMAGMTIEVQAPIFVFREWHRHRVPFSYNEMSARYTPLPDRNYVPTVERLLRNSKTNKQAAAAAGAKELTVEEAELFRGSLLAIYDDAERLYQRALVEGVPKELARVHLPVGRYSRMRASSNLRGWMNFLALRDHEAAQWEIHQYASALNKMLTEEFQRSMALFNEERETRKP